LSPESKSRHILETMVDGYFEVDLEGRILHVNQSLLSQMGHTLEEGVGKYFSDFMEPHQARRVYRAFRRVLRRRVAEKLLSLELRARNGQIRHYESSIVPIFDDSDHISGFCGIARDVTERHVMLAILQASERRYRDLFTNVFDGVFRTSPEGLLLSANPALVKMLGYSSEEELREADIERDIYYAGEERSGWMERLSRDGELRNAKLRLRKKDGTVIHVLENSYAVKNPGGEILFYEGTLTDITEMKAAEERLLAFEKAMETMQLGVTITDTNRKIAYVNPAEARMHGYDVEELIGKPSNIFAPREKRRRWTDRELQRLTSWVREGVNIRKDGSTMPVLLFSDAIRDASGEVTGIVTICEDITERKRSEQTLRESERRYADLVEGAPDPILTVNLDGVILTANPAAEAASGFSHDDIVGHHFAELGMASSRTLKRIQREFFRAQRGEKRRPIEIEIVDKVGNRKFFESKPRPIYKDDQLTEIQVILRDVTHRRLKEEQLKESHDILEHAVNERTEELRQANILLQDELEERHRIEDELRKSEEKFRSLFQNSRDAIFITSRSGTILDVNGAALDMFGYTRAELKKLNAFDIYENPEDRESFIDHIEDDGFVKDMEVRLRRKNGAILETIISATQWRSKDGKILGFQGIIHDVTERVRAEEARRELARRFREMLENVNLMAIILDDQGQLAFCNEHFCSLTGHGKEEVAGINWFETFIPPELREERQKSFFANLPRGRIPIHEERNILTRNGDRKLIFWNNTLLRDSEGNVNGLARIGIDVTEQKSMEQALRESERRFRHIFENAVIGIYSTTSDGKVTMANPALIRMLGFDSIEELARKNLEERTEYEPDYDRDKFKAMLEGEGEIVGLEAIWHRRDGVAINVRESARIVTDEEGEIVGFEGTIEDVTEQKLAERNLKQRQLALQRVYEIATMSGGSFRDVCDLTVQALVEQLDVRHAEVAVFDGEEQRCISTMADGILFHDRKIEISEGEDLTHNCGLCDPGLQEEGFCADFPVRLGSGNLGGLIRIHHDETRDLSDEVCHIIEIFARYLAYTLENEQLEARLESFQRMELLGQVAAGVAHEVRNPLNAILALTEALSMDFDSESEHWPFLEQIRGQVERLTNLMNDLLQLGKPIQKANLFWLNPVDLCLATIETWTETHKRGSLDVRMNVPESLSGISILADGPKLQQVLINLMDNAQQHSPRDASLLIDLAVLTPDQLRIRVKDQGTGIPEEKLNHVFDPFFTTRKSGTGLGLSIVKNIVEAHGGRVRVRNNTPNPGATFEIFMPIGEKGRS